MRILITDDVHPCLISGFNIKGYFVEYSPAITLNEVHDIIGSYDGIVVNTKVIMDKALIDKAIHLKCVARLGSGLDTLDTHYLNQKGIYYFNTPEANCQAVGEHALASFLALARNILRADQEVRNFSWHRELNRGFELGSMCFGIIGCGHTGQAFIRLLKPFGCRIIVFDPNKELSFEDDNVVIAKNMDELLDCSVISLHVDLNSSTRHLIDKKFVDAMKRPFYLINTSRGAVVKTVDVEEGLQSGKILGACLDVFENEKTSTFSEAEHKLYTSLYSRKNVILTPHIAGWTFESKLKIAQAVLSKWPT
ncbi:MAG: NAD(P)-dependent oxidoreductase [Saprospiraceae bacterium]